MHSIAIETATEKSQEFKILLSSAIDTLKNFRRQNGFILRLTAYYIFIRILYTYKRYIVLFRKIIESCDTSCKTPMECATTLCQRGKEIREQLISLGSLAKNSKAFSFFYPRITSVMIDWDDFVEDCSISADKEIRDLLNRIADAA